MKVYVVLVAYTDDDGNLGSYSYVEKTEADAINKVRMLHDKTYESLLHFDSLDEDSEVEDDYEDGDRGFDMWLAEDYGIRTVVCIE